MATTPDAITSLQARFAGQVGQAKEFRSEHTVSVDKGIVADVAAHLKQLGFDYLVDVSSVDNSGNEPRFEVIYEYYNLSNSAELRIKASVSEDDETIPTISHVYATANWHEREIYDMMGLKFTGHPDLRRILMWEGYPFFPLRKEFPLEGKPSDMPDIAFSNTAPLAGGPFVTSPSSANSERREPRSKAPDVA
jgi:NADH-quinone oxidoreductase subunit C